MAETTDEKLRLHIEAVEKLNEEKKVIGDEVKDRMALAKADGYDTKIMRQIIKLRKLNRDDRTYQDEMLEVYRAAVGLD